MHASFFHLKSISFIFSERLLSAKIIFCISKWAFYSFSLFFSPLRSAACLGSHLCEASILISSRRTERLQFTWDCFSTNKLSFSSSANHNHQCGANCEIKCQRADKHANYHTHTHTPTHTNTHTHTHTHAAHCNLKVIMNASKKSLPSWNKCILYWQLVLNVPHQ